MTALPASTLEKNGSLALPWHTFSLSEFLEKQHPLDAHQGLSTSEAETRLKQYGLNQLNLFEKKKWYKVFLQQFTNIFILILGIAAFISLWIHEVADAISIFVILAVNGILGFIQEWKAERALESLRKMLAPHCRVRRNGQIENILAEALVPGDVVALSIGDQIPADLRFIETSNLQVDEAILTGESLPVYKNVDPLPVDTPLAERFSMGWMGTSVTNGRAYGVVVATGMETEFGRIGKLTQTVGEQTTPLQKQLGKLGLFLGILGLSISLGIALIGVLRGKELLEMFLTGISLAVAIIPEGLPAVVTITMALGIRSMVRCKALLRNLQAAETLGKTTSICTDKTGTLTKNEMTLQKIWLPRGLLEVSGIGYEPVGAVSHKGNPVALENWSDLETLLQTGKKCNHAVLVQGEKGWSALGEPTEAALLVVAEKLKLSEKGRGEIVVEFPFNSDRKRMSVLEKTSEGYLLHLKGAPEVVLERCTQQWLKNKEIPLSRNDLQQFKKVYRDFAKEGLRTLALARRSLAETTTPFEADTLERQLTLLGIVGIIDPPRNEVPLALKKAYQAGIQVFMITGDSADTGMAIAKRIGLQAEKALTGSQLTKLKEKELQQELQKKVLFARTTPEHKMRIVQSLQNQGHIVAMTGDGVNDAPALKQADVGIAMGIRGTDVSKGASDIILMDDNFASIIDAVEEGRRQYENIRKFIFYLLSSNTAEMLAIVVNISIGGPLILLPIHILWMNLVTDGITAVALGLEPVEKGLMNRPPRFASSPLISKKGVFALLLIGSYIGLTSFALFHYYLATTQSLILAQTIAFTSLVLLQKINVFNFRSLISPLRSIGFFSNRWLWYAWFTSLGIQLAAIYVPFLQKALHTTALSLNDWFLILLLGLPLLLGGEIFKYLQNPKTSLLEAGSTL
jgi:Ca2+-transporting ATPase